VFCHRAIPLLHPDSSARDSPPRAYSPAAVLAAAAEHSRRERKSRDSPFHPWQVRTSAPSSSPQQCAATSSSDAWMEGPRPCASKSHGWKVRASTRATPPHPPPPLLITARPQSPNHAVNGRSMALRPQIPRIHHLLLGHRQWKVPDLHPQCWRRRRGLAVCCQTRSTAAPFLRTEEAPRLRRGKECLGGFTVVMKFGGSSLASAERMREVADLILNFPYETPVVVLFAMGKTTNNLLLVPSISSSQRLGRGARFFRLLANKALYYSLCL
jgi:hypothetical protein